MTCVSLLLSWYLVTLGPSSQIVARFQNEDQCWRVQSELKVSYTITGHAWTR